MANFVSASEAVKLIKSHDKVYVQGSTSVPEVLLKAMADRAPELKGVEVYSAFQVTAGASPYAVEALKESFYTYSLFVSSSTRAAINGGYGEAIPAFLGEIPGLLRKRIIDLDVVLMNVSEPDENGYCSYGVSADVTVSAHETARIAIAQVNSQMPYSHGDALVHIDSFAACVKVDEPLVVLPTVEPDEKEAKIGQYIAEIIPDGATLQIGVGGIPNAVLAGLGNHKNLGLHTEAMTDGVVPLIEKGIINNSQKKILPGKCLASLALGSQRLYDFMDNNPDVIIRDVAWTNDPAIIRQNPKVMAVNSCIEVDLTGQICADSIGTRLFSSVGGQHDFMYGGSLSEGGRTFIAITSMTEKGKSKINPILAPGAGVVTTRFQTQYVVTEYGAADLQGQGMAERARRLINIAHPSVREELEKAAFERFGYSFLRKR